MNKEPYSKQQLFNAILTGGNERDRALKYVFQHKHYRAMVEDIVIKGGGNEEHGKMVFNNCVILLDKLVRRKLFKTESIDEFFESEAKTDWCRELITNNKARDYVLSNITSDKELERKIHAVIVSNSGSKEDARDTYQNGLIQIDSHMKEGKFRGGAVKGFFYQVCYNLWRNELKRAKMASLPEDGFDISINTLDPQRELERKEQKILFKKIFNQLGESCQKILRLKFFIVDQYSMDEIAEIMGFKNGQIASNTLSKCRKQLWEALQQFKPTFAWNKIM